MPLKHLLTVATTMLEVRRPKKKKDKYDPYTGVAPTLARRTDTKQTIRQAT